MKPEDLMIGDWVLCDVNAQSDYEFDNVKYEPYQIKNGEDIDYACETNMIGDSDVYQPIPLTDEILVKNGWEIISIPGLSDGTEDWAIWPLDSEIEIPFRLQRGYDGHKWWISAGIGGLLTYIDYVHELHHALRQCRIEKEVVI